MEINPACFRMMYHTTLNDGMAGMKTNALPHFDDSINSTGCCPKFNPEGWDGQELHFKNKKFVRATTYSVMHLPLNMAKVFSRIQKKIETARGYDADNFIVLSRDLSPWKSEHYFSVSADLEGEHMTGLTGNFVTRVFEGPYRDVGKWHSEMQDLVRSRGGVPGTIYFFYTTCPNCAKVYGKNYVVGVAQV